MSPLIIVQFSFYGLLKAEKRIEQSILGQSHKTNRTVFFIPLAVQETNSFEKYHLQYDTIRIKIKQTV